MEIENNSDCFNTDTFNSYVYAYLDPRKPATSYEGLYFKHEPFYIGMSAVGDPGRKFSHYYEAIRSKENNYKLNKIRYIKKELGEEKLLENIIVLFDNLSPKQAEACEAELIESIGRIDLNNGPLTNLTSGGMGIYGASDEFYFKRAKNIHKSRQGRSIYSLTPEETKDKVSESMSNWFKQNREKSIKDLPDLKYKRFYLENLKKGLYYYLIISPDGGYHFVSKNSICQASKILKISNATLTWRAEQDYKNENKTFARIMRGSGKGYYCLMFKTLEELITFFEDVTMGNQQPKKE